jgi:hypothetical protein
MVLEYGRERDMGTLVHDEACTGAAITPRECFIMHECAHLLNHCTGHAQKDATGSGLKKKLPASDYLFWSDDEEHATIVLAENAYRETMEIRKRAGSKAVAIDNRPTLMKDACTALGVVPADLSESRALTGWYDYDEFKDGWSDAAKHWCAACKVWGNRPNHCGHQTKVYPNREALVRVE